MKIYEDRLISEVSGEADFLTLVFLIVKALRGWILTDMVGFVVFLLHLAVWDFSGIWLMFFFAGGASLGCNDGGSGGKDAL